MLRCGPDRAPSHAGLTDKVCEGERWGTAPRIGLSAVLSSAELWIRQSATSTSTTSTGGPSAVLTSAVLWIGLTAASTSTASCHLALRPPRLHH